MDEICRVCSWCQKFISFRPTTEFTHGICSACLPKVMAEIEQAKEKKRHDESA